MSSSPTKADLVKAGHWAAEADHLINLAKKVVTVRMDANSVDHFLFIADRAYTVESIKEVHSVVGGASALAKVRKVTADAVAPGAAAGASAVEFVTSGIDLTATANTVQTPALAVTSVAAGDRLALKLTGTLTGLVGHMTIVLVPA